MLCYRHLKINVKLFYASYKGNSQYYALNLTVFVICTSAKISDYDEARFNSCSSETPNNDSNIQFVFSQISKRYEVINFPMVTECTQC